MNSNTQPRPYWSSMTNYILVTTGAVVGLGNIVRFPFFVYEFGGSFVLFYVLCELLISIPILLGELLIGRRGKQNPVGSFAILAMESDASRVWRWIGWLCFIILFISLADYTVSVAFPVAYFSNLLSATAMKNEISILSQTHITDSFAALEICFLIFILITMVVILRGINRGLETISRITVPAYFIILLVLAIYSCTVGNFHQAVNFLFSLKPNASLSAAFFAALTYAFFKLNVGMGSMIVYGSYLPYSVPLGRSTAIIVFLDAIISLLSYFVIYPLLTSPHVAMMTAHTYQESLLFFSQTENGKIIALFFFLAAIMAAWTPTIAMAESAVVTLIERFNLSRRVATLCVFAGAVLLGTAVVRSHTLSKMMVFHHWTFANFIANVSSYLLIPLSAFLSAIFIGWVLNRKMTQNELGFNSTLYSIWRFLVQFVAPILIVITAVMLMRGF